MPILSIPEPGPTEHGGEGIPSGRTEPPGGGDDRGSRTIREGEETDDGGTDPGTPRSTAAGVRPGGASVGGNPIHRQIAGHLHGGVPAPSDSRGPRAGRTRLQ